MLFHSQIFLIIFLPVILTGYYCFSASREWRVWFLIISSFVFYGYWDIRLVPLLAGSITVNWILAVAYRRWSQLPIILLAVMLNLVILGIFKYANFAADTIAWFANSDRQRWSIVLPLGISFFTFQQISYLVDIRRGKAPNYTFHEYALYVSFFPQLIAGPIVRHNELIFQFGLDPRQGDVCENFSRGAVLLLIGLVKKVFIADRLALIADPLFATAAGGNLINIAESITAPLAFGLQIYFDFSGYSDMAIGLALMFGLNLPINFNAPYRATSIREFWRRWHLTLSRFLRDYVYIPAGGSRVGWPRHIFAIMVTMLLGGLWHGAGWTFVAWGGLHGCALITNHLWMRIGGNLAPLPAWILTMVFVFFTWTFFRAETFSAATIILQSMMGRGPSIWLTEWSIVAFLETGGLLVAAVIIALFGPTSQEFVRVKLKANPMLAVLCSLLLVAVLLQVGGGANAEFIYFQF